MKDAFFTSTSATTKKRKRSNNNNHSKNGSVNQKQRPQKNKKQESEESSEDDAIGAGNIDDMDLEDSDSESSEEEIQETAAEKRVRLAKAYLNKIQTDLDDDFAGGFDAADLDRDLIAERLKQDDDESAGRLHRRIADKFDYSVLKDENIKLIKGHQLAVTAAVITDNGSFIYTASKDGSIIKWDANTLKKLHIFPGGRKTVKDFTGHTDHIYCLATSSDNQYLASGGKDNKINIWSIKDDTHLAEFTQHRDSVSGLAFRKGSNQLYSASHDRTIKLWNMDQKAYIETLFGHQDQITAIDTLARERCITTGGRDKTTRLWKIIEESQLVYRGGVSTKNKDGSNKPLYLEGSLDCVAQIDESLFVTGGDSGVISLWDINRKKPIHTSDLSHGVHIFENKDQVEGEGEGEGEGDIIKTPHWITALASLIYSNVFVSGSIDGFVRFWKISDDNKSFTEIAQLPCKGVINSLQFKTVFPSKKTYLIIGIGQELKLGRWFKVKDGVKNGTKIIELPFIKK